jgi:hypothetical protein
MCEIRQPTLELRAARGCSGRKLVKRVGKAVPAPLALHCSCAGARQQAAAAAAAAAAEESGATDIFFSLQTQQKSGCDWRASEGRRVAAVDSHVVTMLALGG